VYVRPPASKEEPPQRRLWRFSRQRSGQDEEAQDVGRHREEWAEEWVKAALDARVEQGLPRAIEDPEALDFIAEQFIKAERVRDQPRQDRR
jgi:hypothetical protein